MLPVLVLIVTLPVLICFNLFSFCGTRSRSDTVVMCLGLSLSYLYHTSLCVFVEHSMQSFEKEKKEREREREGGGGRD